MTDAASSLVRDPQGVRAALARVASTGGSDEAVAALVDELLDPVASLAMTARALMAADHRTGSEIRDEVLALMYDRARDLHDALVLYDWRVRSVASGVE